MDDRQPHHHHQHSVRRIVLPSGRSIEVVRFPDAEERRRTGLHVCPSCRCHLVQPVSWTETEDEQWEITLECPNCWWTTDGVFNDGEVQEFENTLDEGLADMLGDLKRLARANMAEQIDRFVTALRADQILPEDF